MFWNDWAPRPAARTFVAPASVLGFMGTAPHIRGRVTIRGRNVFMEVVNTRTDKVIASDNIALHTHHGKGSGLPYLVDACTAATAAARGAWTYEFRQKDLT